MPADRVSCALKRGIERRVVKITYDFESMRLYQGFSAVLIPFKERKFPNRLKSTAVARMIPKCIREILKEI
jgi:hypothetical protein